MNSERLVRLTQILGDQEEFADLIGTNGKLTLGDRNCYMPENRGDWLTLAVKNIKRDGMKIAVETQLDNTFTFVVQPSYAIVKKKNPEEWLMFQPGGRLDHWGPIVCRVEFPTKDSAVNRRRLENAEHYSDVVEITSDTDLRQYQVVA